MSKNYDYLAEDCQPVAVQLDGYSAQLLRQLALQSDNQRHGWRHEDGSAINATESDNVNAAIDDLINKVLTGETETLTHIRQYEHQYVVNKSTTSTSMVFVPSLYKTITANGGLVIVIATINAYYASSLQYSQFQLAVDLTAVPETLVQGRALQVQCTTMHAYQSVDGQQYQHNLMWRAYNGQELNCYRGHLWVIEL